MKRKIIFALFGVAMFLVGMSVVAMAPNIRTDNYARSSGFRVVMDGREMPDLLSVSQPGLNIEEVELGTGSDNVRLAVPGAGSANTVTFEGILSDDTSIRDWAVDTYNGEDIRKDITIEIYEHKGNTLRTLNLFDCFPTRYEIMDLDAGDKSGVVKWHLEVRVNRIEMA